MFYGCSEMQAIKYFGHVCPDLFVIVPFLSCYSQANDCGPLAIPINGSSLGKETTFPNKVIFRCDKGFILVGSTIRQCLANASWSGMVTTCQGERKAIAVIHLRKGFLDVTIRFTLL